MFMNSVLENKGKLQHCCAETLGCRIRFLVPNLHPKTKSFFTCCKPSPVIVTSKVDLQVAVNSTGFWKMGQALLGPSMNYIEFMFILIAILTFVPGLVANYAEKFLPQAFLRLFRYGRANVCSEEEAKKNNFFRKIEVPKNWFYHVYIYAICLQSFMIYTILTTYANSGRDSWLKTALYYAEGNARKENVNATTTSMVALLFFLQLCRRLYETCFVCVYSNTKMNVLHYLLTYMHYTGCLLTIPGYSPVFSGEETRTDLSIRWHDIRIIQVLSVALFLYGSHVQYQAHAGLAKLRKGKENKVVTLKHQIPRGGMFETISCPNYWGEILIYFAFAAMFLFRNSTWNYIALWVAANQIITGVMNHNWYKATFSDYPKNRKAVIPYIW